MRTCWPSLGVLALALTTACGTGPTPLPPGDGDAGGVLPDGGAEDDAGGLEDAGGLLEDAGAPDAGEDRTPPAVAFLAPRAGTVLAPGPLLAQGTAADEGSGVAAVSVRLGEAGAVAATGTTSWTAAVDASGLPDGAYTLTATATDAAGNSASASVEIVLQAGAVRAVLGGLPREPACLVHGRLPVGGEGIVAYRHSLDGAAFGPETDVATPIVLEDLQPGTDHQLRVIGKTADGTWQPEAEATLLTWTVAEGAFVTFAVDDAKAAAAGTVLASSYRGVLSDRYAQVSTSNRGNDRLSFHLRQTSGSLDFGKIRLRWQHMGRTESVPLGDYVTPTAAWQRVEIPLADLSPEPERRLTTQSLGFAVLPGAGAGSFAVDEIAFTGARDDFLWHGDANPPSLAAAAWAYLDVSPKDGVIDDPDAPSVISFAGAQAGGGYACSSPVETNTKLRPSDPDLAALHDAERRGVAAPRSALPTAHPRLFGADPAWRASFATFDRMPCVPGRSGWGRFPDVKDTWDLSTLGVQPCQGQAPKPLAEHRDAGFYLTIRACLADPPGGDPSKCPTWSSGRASRTLHLIRRLRACQKAGEGDCWYGAADTDALVRGFIDWEMERLPSQVWHRTNPDYFDLGAEPAFRFWCLFLDTLWNEPDLSPAHRQAIRERMSPRIDWFLEQYKVEHGTSMFNGNNWTPVVALGGLWWALTFFYEDARAPRVLEQALDILWGHRRFYLPDGAYMEGASTYVGASVGSLLAMQRLLRAGFGARLLSPQWERVALARHWIVEHIAPDGRGVDFGDAWAGKGGGVTPLELMLLPEVLGDAPVGSLPVAGDDACLVRRVAANQYYDNGLSELWDLDDVLARDWATLGRACDLDLRPGASTRAFLDGGVAMLRARVPGATALARAAPAGPGPDDDRELFYQADETFLAISAVPNEFPHREKDVGAVLWSAFGSRLLWDWGYGDIKGGASYRIESWDEGVPGDLSDDTVALDWDYFPSGTNTLVVEDALLLDTTTYADHDVWEDYNQLTGERATLQTCRVGATLDCSGAASAGLRAVHVDASAVYGATRGAASPADGWMRHVSRWAVVLHDGQPAAPPATDPLVDANPWNDGHLLLVDSFAAKPERGPVSVAEHFFTKRAELATSAACLSDCSAACLADCKVAPCSTSALDAPHRLAWCAPGCLDDCAPACLADCTAPACSSEVHDTLPTVLDATTVELAPRCAMMDDRAGALPEARGRILAASRNGGGFVLDERPLTLRNRTNGIERRHRFRFRPAAPAAEDVRVFLLLAGRKDLAPPAASVAPVACGGGKACFEVSIAGQSKRVTLTAQGGRYLLSGVQ